MQDKVIFDAGKITLIEFKMVKASVNAPHNFDTDVLVGHQLDNSLKLSFNIGERLAKADFSISIQTESRGKNAGEATGDFDLSFIFQIENLEELATTEADGRLRVESVLGNALASVTYSTSRGILLTRLQGTALQRFVLPVINPNKLLRE